MGVVRQLLDLVLLSEDDDDPPPLTMSSRSSSEDEEFSSEDDDRPPPLIRLRTTRLQFLAPYHAYNRPDNRQPASQSASQCPAEGGVEAKEARRGPVPGKVQD